MLLDALIQLVNWFKVLLSMLTAFRGTVDSLTLDLLHNFPRREPFKLDKTSKFVLYLYLLSLCSSTPPLFLVRMRMSVNVTLDPTIETIVSKSCK